jgi:hypothetical protein
VTILPLQSVTVWHALPIKTDFEYTLLVKSQYKILGFLISILFIFPNQPLAATPVNCSPVSSTVGSTTRLTFATTGGCSWTVPTGVRYMKFLIVAAGGGGGGGAYGGGGGGGAVIQSTSVAVTAGESFSISVGAGGTGGDDLLTASENNSENYAGANGGDSSIGSYIAKGGGGGAGYYEEAIGDRFRARGLVGGNQGGSSQNSFGYNLAFTSVTNQASASSLSPTNRIEIFGNHQGGNTLGASYLLAGAGGGGAEKSGGDVTQDGRGGNGGAGIPINFTGTTTYFGGGGGGGATNSSGSFVAGTGGLGGGGAGGLAGAGENGAANTGGGGGGAGFNGTAKNGGNGGSGLIIISYRTDICLENGACKIGDEGPAAGVIFHIDTATSTAYEAAPKHWQSSCALGGLCSIGDIGFGGGAIFSSRLGNYYEASPNSWFDGGNVFGQPYAYGGATENSAFYSINYYNSRWRDPSVADFRIMQQNLYIAGLDGLNGTTKNDFYWTTDRDPQTDREVVINPRTGETTLASAAQVWLNPEYWFKLVGDYSSGDPSGSYTEDASWSALVTGKAIGTGAANTDLMVNSSDAGIAEIANTLVVNSKSDWFVPSQEEMRALVRQSSLFDGLLGEYWTSSTYEPNRTDGAYFIETSNPSRNAYEVKYHGKGLRPIRSFSIAAAALPGVVLTMNSGLRTATFRTVNTISAVATEAGKVTFFADGKKIAGCISVQTSANTASCSWKPSVRKSQQLTARLKTSGGQYSTILILEVAVVSRTTRR